jgi:hypothetical protein
MNDKALVIVGLVVFVLIVAFPFWYGAASGEERPVPEKPDGERCVRDKAYMTASHMELLNEWRDRVVRDGERFLEIEGLPGPANGKWEMSLTNTCLSCHDREASCKRCHDYASVRPYCWDCHIVPEVK